MVIHGWFFLLGVICGMLFGYGLSYVILRKTIEKKLQKEERLHDESSPKSQAKD